MKRMLTTTYNKVTRHNSYTIYTYILDVDGRTEKVEYRTFKTYKEVLRNAYKTFENAKKIWITGTDKFLYEA